MFRVDIVTIFPEAVTPYLQTSMLQRAQEKRRVRFAVHDLRRWAEGKHRKVDDAPYGGGAGMVMMVGPFARAFQALRITPPNRQRTRVLLTSAKGRMFTQRDAERYATEYDRLVILCGHYEGVDERVARHLADEEVSIGPYVLTGGELPALVIADAVTRLIPGVLGNAESPRDESFAHRGSQMSHVNGQVSREYPHYTRPAVFHPNPRNKRIAWRVPKVLLSGDHAAIVTWRATNRTRP